MTGYPGRTEQLQNYNSNDAARFTAEFSNYHRHGELWTHDPGILTSLTVADTPVIVDGWDEGAQSGTDYAVLDGGAGTITIGDKGAGLYRIDATCSFQSSKANILVHGAVYVNGVKADNVAWERTIGTASQTGDASDYGYVYLVPDDELDFRVEASGVTANILITHGGWGIEWIAGDNTAPVFADEDFTTYTEVDPNGKLTVTSAAATGADVDWDEDVYLYKDFGADNFNGLRINFEIRIASTSLNIAIAGPGLTVNTVGDRTAFAATDIFVGAYRTGGGAYQILLVRGDAVANDAGSISADTTYYCTLLRAANADDVNLVIYSDSGRTTVVDTLTVSGYGTGSKYRYLYGIVNVNDGSTGRDWDGFVQNMRII
jgi:hypothetical protein